MEGEGCLYAIGFLSQFTKFRRFSGSYCFHTTVCIHSKCDQSSDLMILMLHMVLHHYELFMRALQLHTGMCTAWYETLRCAAFHALIYYSYYYLQLIFLLLFTLAGCNQDHGSKGVWSKEVPEWINLPDSEEGEEIGRAEHTEQTNVTGCFWCSTDDCWYLRWSNGKLVLIVVID